MFCGLLERKPYINTCFLQAMSSLKRKEKQYKVEVKQHVKQTKCNSENPKKCNCAPMSEQKRTIILQYWCWKKYIQEISVLLNQQKVKRTESRKKWYRSFFSINPETRNSFDWTEWQFYLSNFGKLLVRWTKGELVCLLIPHHSIVIAIRNVWKQRFNLAWWFLKELLIPLKDQNMGLKNLKRYRIN